MSPQAPPPGGHQATSNNDGDERETNLLRAWYRSLTPPERVRFAARAETTPNYIERLLRYPSAPGEIPEPKISTIHRLSVASRHVAKKRRDLRPLSFADVFGYFFPAELDDCRRSESYSVGSAGRP